MPGHAVHIDVARSFLTALPEAEASAWTDNPDVLNALFHGALDPDMGYFPAGDPLVTDLSHYVKTADLIRTFVRLAETPTERAYAWGWVTHFVADTQIHPSVNRCAGLLLNGTVDRPATWADSPSSHVRVEQGLDAVRLAMDTSISRYRLRSVASGPSAGLLVRAFQETYGVSLEKSHIAKAHRSVDSVQRAFFPLGTAVGRKLQKEQTQTQDLLWLALYYPVRWLASLLGEDSILYSFTHTYAPPEWFQSEVAHTEAGLTSYFAGLLNGGLEHLDNLNLDTGHVDQPDSPYPMTEKALQTLEDRRSR